VHSNVRILCGSHRKHCNNTVFSTWLQQLFITIAQQKSILINHDGSIVCTQTALVNIVCCENDLHGYQYHSWTWTITTYVPHSGFNCANAAWRFLRLPSHLIIGSYQHSLKSHGSTKCSRYSPIICWFEQIHHANIHLCAMHQSTNTKSNAVDDSTCHIPGSHYCRPATIPSFSLPADPSAFDSMWQTREASLRNHLINSKSCRVIKYPS